MVSSNSVQTVPFTLASGNLDQLNDLSGFDGLGTFLISVRTGGNDGGGAGAHGGAGGPGTGGGGGGGCLGATMGVIPLHCFSCGASVLVRFNPTTCGQRNGSRGLWENVKMKMR